MEGKLTAVKESRLQRESAARARRAAELASQGQYQCRFCKKLEQLNAGIVVTWGGNVMFALCPSCMPERPIVIRQQSMSDGRPGVFIGFLKSSDKPADIVVASSMKEVNDLVGTAGIATFSKRDLGE